MSKKYERQVITSIDYVVPGLPLYYDIGEKIAGSLYDFFDYSQKDVGYLYGYIGLWLVFSQGVIVRKLSGKVAPKNVPKYSLLALAIGVIIVLFPQDPIWFFWIIILIPLSQSISNPFMTTILSESTSPERQGEMLGIKQSLYSLGTVITPLIGGWINTYNVLYSIVAGGVIIFLAWVIYVLIYIKKY